MTIGFFGQAFVQGDTSGWRWGYRIPCGGESSIKGSKSFPVELASLTSMSVTTEAEQTIVALFWLHRAGQREREFTSEQQNGTISTPLMELGHHRCSVYHMSSRYIFTIFSRYASLQGCLVRQENADLQEFHNCTGFILSDQIKIARWGNVRVRSACTAYLYLHIQSALQITDNIHTRDWWIDQCSEMIRYLMTLMIVANPFIFTI